MAIKILLLNFIMKIGIFMYLNNKRKFLKPKIELSTKKFLTIIRFIPKDKTSISLFKYPFI